MSWNTGLEVICAMAIVELIAYLGTDEMGVWVTGVRNADGCDHHDVQRARVVYLHS